MLLLQDIIGVQPVLGLDNDLPWPADECQYHVLPRQLFYQFTDLEKMDELMAEVEKSEPRTLNRVYSAAIAVSDCTIRALNTPFSN